MATYSTLSIGSSGSEVKKLQQSLVDAGYNVGSSGVDGIYGSNTAAAVKKYQQASGLTVDGSAGNETLGALYSSSAGTGTTAATPAASSSPVTDSKASPDYSGYAYDADADAAYQDALSALESAKSDMPTYAGSYDSQLDDLYQQIVNRDKFSYDLNSDMLYQQYKDQYVQQGGLAMQDTMGQAAALTGGYGSSYSQSVGQQQYDAYLQDLNNMVPELYGAALDKYTSETEGLFDQYSLASDMASDEYSKYQDALDMHNKNVANARDEADTAYERGESNWYNSYELGTKAQEAKYDELVTLMTSTGYVPSAEELSAAGMSDSIARSYMNYYKSINGGSGPGDTDETPIYDDGQTPIYDDGQNSDDIAEAAAEYYSAHPNVYLDSRTLDMWLSNNGYSGDSATAFKAFMQSYGATTSGRG